MAVTVQQQVIERALRNAPRSQQTPPKFGTFNWAMNSAQGAAVLTPPPSPLPDPLYYSALPSVLYISGGNDPQLSNRFFRKKLSYADNIYQNSYLAVEDLENGYRWIKYGPYNNAPWAPWNQWIIQNPSGVAGPSGYYYTCKVPPYVAPYIGLSGYNSTCNTFYPWVSGDTVRPLDYKPHCLRGFPDNYDQAWLPEEIQIEGVSSFIVEGFGPPIDIKDIFSGTFVWNASAQKYFGTSSADFGIYGIIIPAFVHEERGGYIRWAMRASSQVDLYTNNWPFCSFPCNETPYYNTDKEFNNFSWLKGDSQMPSITAIKIIQGPKPLPAPSASLPWPCPPPLVPPVETQSVTIYKLNP